jgi:hypothetical protein
MLVFGVSCSAMAQNKTAGVKTGKSLTELISMAREGRPASNSETVKLVKEAYSERKADDGTVTAGNELVGTWNCTIGESDGGNPPFEALQTFNFDGTFVETSSLLGMNGEGPAHGAWERNAGGYLLTFELFVFDPETGESVGRVRVRNIIRVAGSRMNFTSYNVVDFIEPDGNVIEGIDSGIYTAQRLQVRGV